MGKSGPSNNTASNKQKCVSLYMVADIYLTIFYYYLLLLLFYILYYHYYFFYIGYP